MDCRLITDFLQDIYKLTTKNSALYLYFSLQYMLGLKATESDDIVRVR